LLNVASTERSSGVQLTKSKGLRTLLRELSDDEDEMEDTGTAVPDDPRRPWLRDYRAYLDVLEQVPEGWTVIQWWGVSWISVAIISIRTNITCNSTIPGGIILPGLPLREITSQSCRHRCQVSVPFHRVGSQSQNAEIVSREIL
jgi:hypothetical protein